MENRNYWIITTNTIHLNGAFLCDTPDDGPKSYLYGKGVSLLGKYPTGEEAGMYFDPDYPDNKMIHDFVDNINDLLVVTEAVKNQLEKIQKNNIEFLNVWLYDHDDKVVSKDYYIINVIGSQEIIDIDKSEIVMDSLVKTQIFSINKLVLTKDKVSSDAKIFRATNKLDQIFVTDEVKNVCESRGFVGCKFTKAEGWNGL